MSRRFFWSVPAMLYVMVIFLAACSPSDQPRVSVSSPSNGSKFSEGQVIPIQSVSTDSSGITRVEVFIDGFMLHTVTLPKPQPEFSATQDWQATPGSHIISVRAFNTGGVASEPVMLRVAIVPAVNPLLDSTLVPDSPTPSPAASPTITPTVVLTPTAASPLPTTTPVPLSVNTGNGGGAPAPSNTNSRNPVVPPPAPVIRPQPTTNTSPAPPPPSSGGSPSQGSGNGNGNGHGGGNDGGNGHGKGLKNN